MKLKHVISYCFSETMRKLQYQRLPLVFDKVWVNLPTTIFNLFFDVRGNEND